MSLKYIRDFYNVPAKRGQRVLWRGMPGRITAASGPHVRIRMDDPEMPVVIAHPTDEALRYLEVPR